MVLPFSPHCPHGSFSRLSFCLYLHFLLPDDVRFCLQTVVVERPLCKLFGEGDGNYSVQAEFNVSDEKFEPFIIKYDMAFSVTSYNISVTKRNHTGILTAYTLYRTYTVYICDYHWLFFYPSVVVRQVIGAFCNGKILHFTLGRFLVAVK